MTTRSSWCCLSLFLMLVCTAACTGSEDRSPIRPAQLPRANVLLVTIDTLRVDRVGVYGNGASLTPTIDRLAAGGVRYTHAWSHAPMTLPAHTSILTGLLPPHSAVRNNTSYRLADSTPTLATMLKGAGYRTGAFVGAFVLDARFGLARAFDVYDDRLPRSDRTSFRYAERKAADVVKAAGDWIASSSTGPWFAWVHLFDPHAPYDAPAAYRAGRSAYDAEVAYADAMLGTLVDRLRAARLLETTLVVLTADHGESLGDHGETTHGLFAYDSTLRVPLVVTGGTIPSRTVDAAAAHVDIVPTVLDLVGLPVPANLDGMSLARAASANRPIYFEALDASLTRGWAPLRGIVQSGWKYIDLPRPELYDLTSDPQEARNRVGDDRRGDAMARALGDIESTTAAPATPATLDADAARRLRSLGYTGTATQAPRKMTSADDPKALVALNERFNAALTDFEEGRHQQALSGFLSVIAERPDFLAARATASTVLVGQRQAADAVRLLREAPPDQQRSPELLLRLGTALRAAGDLRQAAAAFEEAHRVDDRNLDVLQELAVTDAALGRLDEARARFTDSVTRSPTAATAWYNFGLFELQSGHAPAAAALFRRAVDRDPSYGDAWQALGAALVSSDTAGALDAWRHAEPLLPGDYDLLFNLGMLSAEHDAAHAAPYLRRFVSEAPRARYARDIARVQQTLSRLERGRP